MWCQICPLFLSHLNALTQAFNLKLLASAAAVDVLHIIGGGLEVRCGIVALGDEHVVLGTVVKRLVDGDRRALGCHVSLIRNFPNGRKYGPAAEARCNGVLYHLP